MAIIERIKCFLRANPYYKKYLQTHINDFRYFYRSCRYYVKYYSLRIDKTVTGNTLFFIIDPAIKHPGLADRLKAIVGCYYIATQNDFDFKIIFETPFILSDYLDVCQCNWLAGRADLSFSIRNTRVTAYNGGGKVPKLHRSVKQYHIYSYIGYDILETNRIPDYKKRWGVLFNELFKPKDFLLQQLRESGFTKNKYNAVHIRFVNALEHFEADFFNDLSASKKENLIQRCIAGLEILLNQDNQLPLLVFSDSRLFLNRARALPLHILDGPIGHISYDNKQETVTKTFLDFYMIAHARNVFVMHAPELYNSVYPFYAASAGYKEVNIMMI